MDPSAHMMELIYRPPRLIAGFFLSALSILAAFVLAWRTSRPSGAARGALR